jgi:hypothetical protein
MADREFHPNSENNGLLHPPNCVCVRCSAGRESQELDEGLKIRIREMLDQTLIEMVKGNVMGGFQALAAGGQVSVVRSQFLGNMGKIMQMREMATAYFADENPDGV